jgi:2-polyprenyl-3-methyl-5-hydroxy-6-metoxy-1,4-benzoquinol methylase
MKIRYGICESKHLAHSPRGGFNPESDLADYTSSVLHIFVEALEHCQEPQVLDLGPVCGENITFLARRVQRLYVCDMFIRLDRNRRKGVPLSWAWRQLDYPARSFDGILLWDLADHLNDKEVRRLVESCRNMVKPGGMITVFVLGAETLSNTVNSFVIGDGLRMHLRPQPHLDLQLHVRQNREVLSLFTPFTPVRSFICRNGLREFLFRLH